MSRRQSKRRRHTGSRILLFVLMAVILLILAGIYVGVSMYYRTHFFPGTYINGMDCSGMTVEEAENRIANKAEDFILYIHEREGKLEQIDGAHMGYQYLSDGSVQAVKDAENPMEWMYAYFHPESYSSNVITSYDKEKLRSAMEKLNCFDEKQVTSPQDAYIDDSGTSYALVAEVEGNQLDEEKTYQLLKDAMDAGKNEVDLEAAGCYLEPAVRTSDENLQKQYETLKKYENMTITYLIGDQKEVLDSLTIRKWMDVADDGSVTFNWNMAADWLTQLGDKYDTIGTQQKFTTSLGETLMVEAVTYGWKIDEEHEIDELLAALQEGKSIEKEPLYLETAKSHGTDSIGNTYVEIDYTNQRMWFYKDGQCLVDTPVVTGNTSKDMGSPIGIYCIYNKEENATLKGEDYETPVDFWMPFYGGVGIHDSKWRSEYGGTIYQTGGSHGCINTPWEKAKIIFENISIGDPVICYNGSVNASNGSTTVESQTSTNEAAQDHTAKDGSNTSDSADGSGQTDGTSSDVVIIQDDTYTQDASGNDGSREDAAGYDTPQDSDSDSEDVGADWPTQEWNGYVDENGVIVVN